MSFMQKINILYAGKKIRTHRRKRRSKKAEDDAKAQFARAQIAVVEQINATAIKEDCQAKVEKDEQNAVDETTGTRNGEGKSAAVVKHLPHIPQLVNNTAMVYFRQLVGQARDLSEERSLVISNTVNLLQALLDQWTNLAADSTAAASADEAEPPTARVENEQTPRESNSDAATGSKGTDDAQDIWRNHYLLSQKRVEELEAELLKMKMSENINSRAESARNTEAEEKGTRKAKRREGNAAADETEPASRSSAPGDWDE
ncbi:hypothetical protein CLAIMM_05762 [Cladophialophora immunda]|nr:hypothetical protein CLAIMM_05762 [Cladophialophora immunda]